MERGSRRESGRAGARGLAQDIDHNGAEAAKHPRDRAEFDRRLLDELPRALAFAVRLTGRLDAAEDLVQEALVRVARSWGTFRGECEFRSWLFQIVVNAFRDRLKRPAAEELPDQLTDPRPIDPSAAAMAKELQTLVAWHVSNLPPRQREVLVLTVYEELPARQIAAIVGITEANVHSTLHAARATLKRKLAQYLAND